MAVLQFRVLRRRGSFVTPVVACLVLLVVSSLLWAAGVAWRRERDRNKCVENLRLIAEWKEMWGMINKMGPNATPTSSQLVGSLTSKNDMHDPTPTAQALLNSLPTGFIRAFPTCPSGGKYVIGRLSEPPRCTYPGHSFNSR